MISVLTSCLGDEVGLHRAVRSSLAGLPAEGEVIVHVDSRSAFELRNRARWPNDARVKLVFSDVHLGFAEGLNFAASMASNSLLARIDADDVSLPWRWQVQLRNKRAAHFHFGGIVHAFRIFGTYSVWIPNFPTRLSANEFATILPFQNPGFHSSVLMSKREFDRLGGYRDCVAEDYDLWLRAASRGMRLVRDAMPVVAFGRHRAQATASPNWLRRVEEDNLISEAKKDLVTALSKSGVDPIIQFRDVALAKWTRRREFRYGLGTITPNV